MSKVGLILLALIAGYVWWQGRKAAVRKRRATPDEREARAILGLRAGDGEPEIRAAHRRLLAAVHPDRGGSADLAQRINLARDVLLRQPR